MKKTFTFINSVTVEINDALVEEALVVYEREIVGEKSSVEEMLEELATVWLHDSSMEKFDLYDLLDELGIDRSQVTVRSANAKEKGDG